MRFFLTTTTCLTAVAAAATPVAAQTVISTAITTPVLTSTNNNDVTITTAGSVKPASGAAVTVDSNDNLTNQGVIAITGANNAVGILINPGLTSNVTNSGTITIDEAYTPTDTDSDGDLDGPFAQGTGRFGIHLLGGGTLTGAIANSGTITVEGNNSGGIALDSALAGNLNHSGTITVIGDNGVGIRTSAVSGNVALTNGAINVQGANSVGLDVTGAVGGSLSIQSTITASGYRTSTAPADQTKLDADDLLQGGPAVRVSGDVAQGIIVDIRPADASATDTDEDDDGILDANEGNGSLLSYGSAPALAIGSTSADISVGALTGSTFGFVNKGSINGVSVYDGLNSTGVAIGGTGHAVSIAGGMINAGGIGTKAIKGNGTALLIGAGATLPQIVNTGTIAAEGGGTATTSGRAIDVAVGANVSTITNSGKIIGIRNGTEGTAYAIIDRSGTVSLIENSGEISVTSAATLGDKAIAFDLSANAAGATVHQKLVATGAAPVILGSMIFGAGNDSFVVDDGAATGAVTFGAGTDSLSLSGDAVVNGPVTFGAGADSVSLAGTSKLTGALDFGGAASTLSLTGTSLFSGSLANSAGVAVNVGAGTTLGTTNTGSVQLASLTTGTGSTLGVVIGTGGAHTLYDVSGNIAIGGPTTLGVTLANVGDAAGTYVVLDGGTGLTGANQLSTDIGTLPFLFDSSLATDVAANAVSLTIRQKTAAELGLNGSEAAALDAIIDAVDADSGIGGVFLGIADQGTLRSTIQQMLPDHAGGTFDSATKGVRLAAQMLSDPAPHMAEAGGLNFWLQQFAWGHSKSIGDTSSYKIGAWGAAGGVETSAGKLGNVGVSLAYSSSKDGSHGDSLRGNQYEVAATWRGGIGPLRGFARLGAGRVSYDSTRLFSSSVGGTAITRTAEGKWKGSLLSAIGGAFYDARFGRFSLRPIVQLEHFKLTEKGYSEANGGDALDLTVDRRSSSETALAATLAAGYQLIQADKFSDAWMRLELEGGRRQILSGHLGDTTAYFLDGDRFTLHAEDRTSGWQTRLRLSGGGGGFSLAGDVEAEQQQGRTGIGGRVTARFGL